MAKHGKPDGDQPTKKAKGTARQAASGLRDLQGHIQRVRFEATPIIRAMSTTAPPLPDVTAPSLEGLVVELADPGPPTTDEVLRAFHDALRAIAEKRGRAPGERPARGDDVVLNMLAYAQGAIVPFSVKMQWKTELAPFPHLPGLAEAIVDIPVGEGRAVALVFPDDYPVARYRGVAARFLVDVVAATEVRMPDADDPRVLLRLGRGKTIDDVMASLAAEVDGEKGEALLVEAQEAALHAMADRVRAHIPAALVDEEILRAWGRVEGGALALLKFTADEQEEALAAWRSDPETRRDAERRIKIGLGLRALAEREGISVEKSDVLALVKDIAAITGLRAADVTRALKESTADTARVVDVARQMKLVSHVVACAQFRFVDED